MNFLPDPIAETEALPDVEQDFRKMTRWASGKTDVVSTATGRKGIVQRIAEL